MFSKIFTEIKTYKKLLLLHISILLLSLIFFLFQKHYLIDMHDKYPLVIYSILGLMCFQMLIRIFSGKDIWLDFSKNCLFLFSCICIALIFVAFYDISHNITKPYPGMSQYNTKEVSQLELIGTPMLYYSIIFLTLQSILGIFFVLLPQSIKKHRKFNKYFAFLFIIFIFAATIIFIILN